MKGWYCTNLVEKSKCTYEHCGDCPLGVSKEVIDVQSADVEKNLLTPICPHRYWQGHLAECCSLKKDEYFDHVCKYNPRVQNVTCPMEEKK